MVAEPQFITARDFAKLPESPTPVELIDGVVIVPPGASFRHNRIAFRIAAQLTLVSDTHQLGEWNVGPNGIYISPNSVYKPDAVFFDAEHPADDLENPIMQIPQIAIEVLSPSSRSNDLIRKRAGYAERGVAEYWIIDPDQRRITLHFLADPGTYLSQPMPGATIPAGIFAGSMLDLEAIFTRPSWIERTSTNE
jgi:Uma2 family endonuclease